MGGPPPGYPAQAPGGMVPANYRPIVPQAPPPKKFDEGKFYRFINILEILLRIIYGAVKGIKEAGPELMEAAKGPQASAQDIAAKYGPGGTG